MEIDKFNTLPANVHTQMVEDNSPTESERAAFYIEQSQKTVGHVDMLKTAVGESTLVPRPNGVNTVRDALDNLEMAFHEGVTNYMSNRREVGHSPVSAWNTAVKDEWPEWVKAGLAESEHQAFGGRGRDPDFMTEEEEEYLAFLEENYL